MGPVPGATPSGFSHGDVGRAARSVASGVPAVGHTKGLFCPILWSWRSAASCIAGCFFEHLEQTEKSRSLDSIKVLPTVII
jgi:hypothetical protein